MMMKLVGFDTKWKMSEMNAIYVHPTYLTSKDKRKCVSFLQIKLKSDRWRPNTQWPQDVLPWEVRAHLAQPLPSFEGGLLIIRHGISLHNMVEALAKRLQRGSGKVNLHHLIPDPPMCDSLPFHATVDSKSKEVLLTFKRYGDDQMVIFHIGSKTQIYTSPLRRTSDTALYLLRNAPFQPHIHPTLAPERRSGFCTGPERDGLPNVDWDNRPLPREIFAGKDGVPTLKMSTSRSSSLYVQLASRATPCTGPQPLCWKHTSLCDMTELGFPGEVAPCDTVASYCDRRTHLCRATRVEHPKPNRCVEWATMQSAAKCGLRRADDLEMLEVPRCHRKGIHAWTPYQCRNVLYQCFSYALHVLERMATTESLRAQWPQIRRDIRALSISL